MNLARGNEVSARKGSSLFDEPADLSDKPLEFALDRAILW